MLSSSGGQNRQERNNNKQSQNNGVYNVISTNSMNLDSLFLFNFTIISTYFAPVDIDIVPRHIGHIFTDFVHAIGNISETVSANALCPIHFTELQTILLTIFLVIFSINLALIGFYWQKYGGVITDRFIRQSTLKEIEELKLSVAKLKLPIEHTPRI